jgi:hypothetical protein
MIILPRHARDKHRKTSCCKWRLCYRGPRAADGRSLHPKPGFTDAYRTWHGAAAAKADEKDISGVPTLRNICVKTAVKLRLSGSARKMV